LAADGHTVVGVDIDPSGLTATGDGIAGAGGSFRSMSVDIVPSGAFGSIVADVESTIGPVEILCNVAGIGVAGTALETSDEDWDRIFALNVTAVFRACRAALPPMLERGGGTIVNVASVAGVVGVPKRAAYCASKAALIGLTRSLAADFAPSGIRVNAICPGTVDTEWIQKILANDPDRERTRAAMAARQLDGRMGSPEEVAEGVAFLVHELGRFMNGAALIMDGGLSAV
jgi:NAD(P)-dependent dehydrogenase (short-subunit alcohol dehydrogenase family)